METKILLFFILGVLVFGGLMYVTHWNILFSAIVAIVLVIVLLILFRHREDLTEYSRHVYYTRK